MIGNKAQIALAAKLKAPVRINTDFTTVELRT